MAHTVGSFILMTGNDLKKFSKPGLYFLIVYGIMYLVTPVFIVGNVLHSIIRRQLDVDLLGLLIIGLPALLLFCLMGILGVRNIRTGLQELRRRK